MKTLKKVVIIGGGFAGSTLARSLEREFYVILIDNKEYFEFTPSILRVIVEPQHLKKIQVPHTNYLKKARVIIGEVTNVTAAAVTVNNKKIPFDYLALCAGSSYASPIKESQKIIPLRAKSLFAATEKLKAAERILIIGGGLVGIELAAEIREKYPDKKITIVHATPHILERHRQRTRAYILDYLSKKDINVKTNERVMRRNGKNYTTNRGTKIQADLAFFCTGITPNITCLEKSSLKESLLNNCITVNAFLQLPQHSNIFAAGDVNSCAVEKTAQNAEQQANIIAHNIRALENDKPLKEYREKRTPIVISLGKWNGIFESPSVVITGLLPGILKSIIEWKEMRKYK